MILLLLLLFELTLLYFLASRLTQAVYDFTILITRSRTVAITVITFLAFPGTVIHELSHLFTAEILGVRTGKLTLVPEGLETDEIKAGSVMVAQSDPFRRSAIGCAPVFAGLVAIATLSYLISLPMNHELLTGFYYYLLFAVSSSMFSSSEDLKGFVPFAIALGAMLVAAYVAGIRIGITGTLLSFVTKILDALTKNLGVVLAINLAGLSLVWLLKIIVIRFKSMF